MLHPLSLNVYIIYARFCRNKRQMQPWIIFNKNNAINAYQKGNYTY